MKTTSEMVWPMENYTDKIHFAVKCILESSPMPYSVEQMIERIKGGFSWLTVTTQRQIITLRKIVKTALTRLTQQGKVRQVWHKTQTDAQWMWHKFVADSGFKDITNNDNVARSESAIKAIARRAASIHTIFNLNRQAA